MAKIERKCAIFTFMEMLFSWKITSFVVGIAITFALGTLALNDYGLAKFCFVIATVDALGGTIFCIWRSGLNVWWQGVLVFVAGGCICLLLFLSLRYVDSKKAKVTANSPLQEQPVHKDAAVPDAKKLFPQRAPIAPSKPHHHPLPHEDELQSGRSNAQYSQTGTSNQKTIVGNNAPVQTMIDSPGGIQAGRDVNITGKITPPPRYIPQSRFAAAVSILETAPAGSKVSFTIVGGSKEITDISNQIKGLFAAAKDKWEILSNSFIGSLNSVEVTDTGIKTFHGEGINCSFGTSETLTYKIGVKAMEAAGIPCGIKHLPGENSSADISIMIGTRIVPEE